MKKVFTKKHIGEKVHCSKHGNGTIISVKEHYEHYTCQIVVEFDESLSFNDILIRWYTTDGRYANGSEVTLSFGHKCELDYGEPEFKYKPLKFDGTPTWCWVGDSVESLMRKLNKKQVIAYDETREMPYWSVYDGDDNMHCKLITLWAYAMALTDEELNDEEGFVVPTKKEKKND